MIEHPFINYKELEEKSLEELQETTSQLMNKLSFAYRTGNLALINQLQMVIESYRNQQRKRLDEIFDKQKINTSINIDKK